jgi:hypothetical protein
VKTIYFAKGRARVKFSYGDWGWSGEVSLLVTVKIWFVRFDVWRSIGSFACNDRITPEQLKREVEHVFSKRRFEKKREKLRRKMISHLWESHVYEEYTANAIREQGRVALENRYDWIQEYKKR